MKYGLRIPSFALGPRTASLDEMGRYLRRAEDLGFDSAVSIDHLLLTPPAYACTWLEPMSLLSALAGVTRTIKLGTMVLVLPLRNPVYFAKEWATFDLLSGGRSILGIGVGWHETEFALMGVPYRERGARMNEAIEVVKALWAGDRVTYEGRFHRFRDLTIDPKPMQKPHPPVILGGHARNVLERVVAWGDGWLPNRMRSHEALKERIKRDGLEHKFGEILVPTEEVVEMRDGQKRKSERKFYPGYVLVEMDMDDQVWHLVKSTPRVTGFVGTGQQPTPLSEDEVNQIVFRVAEGKEKPKLKVKFEKNEAVRITEGPFADFSGTVEEVLPEKGKVKVSVSLFGRPTTVELDYLQLRGH